MKIILIVFCLVLANSLKGDVPSILLCLGEFESTSGEFKSYYFNLISDYAYADGNIDVKGKVLELNENTIIDSKVFTKFYELVCGNEHLYGIDKNDVVPIDSLKMTKVKIEYLVYEGYNSYLGLLSQGLLSKLKLGNCNCKNFDIDLNFQEYACSNGESYFLVDNIENRKLKNLVNSIKEKYKNLRIKMNSPSYRENEKKYRKFIDDSLKEFENRNAYFFIHYI